MDNMDDDDELQNTNEIKNPDFDTKAWKQLCDSATNKEMMYMEERERLKLH